MVYRDTGNWKDDTITGEQMLQLLKERIGSVSFDSIREDIVRFIPDDSVLAIWSPQYFMELIDKMKFRE